MAHFSPKIQACIAAAAETHMVDPAEITKKFVAYLQANAGLALLPVLPTKKSDLDAVYTLDDEMQAIDAHVSLARKAKASAELLLADLADAKKRVQTLLDAAQAERKAELKAVHAETEAARRATAKAQKAVDAKLDREATKAAKATAAAVEAAEARRKRIAGLRGEALDDHMQNVRFRHFRASTTEQMRLAIIRDAARHYIPAYDRGVETLERTADYTNGVFYYNDGRKIHKRYPLLRDATAQEIVESRVATPQNSPHLDTSLSDEVRAAFEHYETKHDRRKTMDAWPMWCGDYVEPSFK